MTIIPTKWTCDEYHQTVAVEVLRQRQVELMKGEIVEMPLEGPEYAQLSTDAADA